MRMFDFHTPQDIIAPKFWTNTQNLNNVNAGRYIRNTILDGITYSAGEHCPAWLKTRDAVHPFVGMLNQVRAVSSDYGGADASAALMTAILYPWNEFNWWSPGGNGVGAWTQVKLPDPTLVESYAVGSKAASAPLSWTLQGSMDGATWSNVHVLENTGVWDATYELKEFTIPAETRGAYQYYRLNITASNATTMSIRNFRLFRPASVCAKGQLLIDASALSPLTMSFADGFDADGVTPVDHVKSITSASLLNMFDANGYPAVRHTAITMPILININAVLDPSAGTVSIETEDACLGAEIVQASGGMNSVTDKGWTCNANNSIIFSKFGALTDTSSSVNYSHLDFRTKNIGGIYASKFYVYRAVGYGEAPSPVCVFEIGGAITKIGESNGDRSTYNIGRRIQGVCFLSPIDSALGTVRLYSRPQPQLRMNNGKVYTRAASGQPWTECHKVRLGSVILAPNGEVMQPLPVTTIQGQVNYQTIAEE